MRALVVVVAAFGCTGEITASKSGGDGAPESTNDDPPAGDDPVEVECDPVSLGSVSLTEGQKAMLAHVAVEVLPGLARIVGDREEAIRQAAEVTWWSLKEGVLDTPNPIGFSLCDRPRVNLTDQPLALCERNAWQVGISAIQSPRPNAVSAATVASKIADHETSFQIAYPGTPVEMGLRDVVGLAGHGEEVADSVAESSSYLRASWLLRIGAIGFAAQAPIVRHECVDEDRSWCHGTGWSQEINFAADRATADRTREELSALFASCFPE